MKPMAAYSTISKITSVPPATIAASNAWARCWNSRVAAPSMQPPTRTVRNKPGIRKSANGLLCASADRADGATCRREPSGRAINSTPPTSAVRPVKASSVSSAFSLVPRRTVSSPRPSRPRAFMVMLLPFSFHQEPGSVRTRLRESPGLQAGRPTETQHLKPTGDSRRSA